MTTQQNSRYTEKMEAILDRASRTAADSSGAVAKAEMRDRPRVPARGLVTVYWRDENRQIRNMRSFVRNLSGGGMLVLSFRPLPVGAFIRLRASKLYFLAGTGRVRHCRRWGFAYLIGMKLDTELAVRF